MEIVENRRGRLSRPFLSPGDNFSKSYDENQIWAERQRAGRADLWGLNPPARARTQGFEPARAARAYPRYAPPRSGFRHNFSKNYPQYLKMV